MFVPASHPIAMEIAKTLKQIFHRKILFILLILVVLFATYPVKIAESTPPIASISKSVRSFQVTPTLSIIVTTVPSKIPFPTILMTTAPKSEHGTTYYIDPAGKDSNDGQSAGTPFQAIQKAVDLAQPGDLIYLSPGTYLQDVITKREGVQNTPITITGSKEAVVKGGGGSRVFEIRHGFINIKGFTLDGQYGKGESGSDFRDKLLYVLGTEPKSGVSNLKITDMTIQNAGGECIRMRYFAQNNELSGNTITNCGIHDFRFNAGGKNGEGIYIGTAPEQLGDGKNPTDDPDHSNNNWVHHNTIDTQGNECVDIKEGSSGNIIENNSCTGQKDPNSGGMDSRGNGNTFRHNNIFDNEGAGIRLGGDSEEDGVDNDVYRNVIRNNKAGGIKLQRIPGKKICGNIMFGNNGGDSVGTFKGKISPTAACR